MGAVDKHPVLAFSKRVLSECLGLLLVLLACRCMRLANGKCKQRQFLLMILLVRIGMATYSSPATCVLNSQDAFGAGMSVTGLTEFVNFDLHLQT